jgi:ParB-like chromosome segregation protein Spo0J
MNAAKEFKVKKSQKKLSELHVADYNPRKSVHDDPEFYTKLYNSILKFDYIDPIIINVKDGKNVIVGGNQRYAVLCDMAEDSGLKLDDVNVDVIEVEYDEPMEMAANIALNRIEGDWIQDKLIEDLEYIRGMDEDLAVTTGFTLEELDKLQAELTEKEDAILNPKFTIHISLDEEYESYYDFYINTNGEEKLKQEIIKIIVGAGNGPKEDKR